MKIALLSVLFFIGCLGLYGQGETKIGIKAGFTSANVYGPDVNQLSSGGSPAALNGFHFGLFINSKIGKHFWIKSEVLTVQKGGVLQIKDKWGQQYSGNFKSQYIDVYPISPTFHYKGFQLLAGPYVSMLLSASIQQKDSLGILHTNSSIFGSAPPLSNYMQKLDAGFVVGIEYELKWGISIGGRYTQGYVPLIENAAAILKANAPELPQQKIFNKSLSVSLGYSFGGHKSQSGKARK